MTTTPHWNSGEHEKAHGDNWRRWLGHLKDKPGVFAIELGSWLGESAEWFCQNIVTTRNSTFICVDTFKGSAEHRLAGIDCSGHEATCRQRLIDFAQADVRKDTTNHFLRQIGAGMEKPFVDFVYCDASHAAQDVLRDAVLSFDLLKVGGVLIFDDYAWSVMEAEVDRPKMAIDAFVACYARQLEVIGMGWQLAVKRTA